MLNYEDECHSLRAAIQDTLDTMQGQEELEDMDDVCSFLNLIEDKLKEALEDD